MALPFSDGFESNDYSNWDDETESDGACDIESTSPIYVGSKSSQHTLTATDGEAYLTRSTDVDGNATIYARMYVYLDSNFYDGIGAGKYQGIMLFQEWISNWDWIAYLFIDGDSSNKLKVQIPGPAWTSSSTNTISAGQWSCVEMRVTVHATEGIVQVWIDGNLEINATGLDTKVTDDDIGAVHVGFHGGDVSDETKMIMHIDNVKIDDSYIGLEQWLHKINSVDNPGKVNSVDAANIASISGVVA